MASLDLLEASRSTAVSDGSFTWLVPDGWLQGRATFGGLVLAAMTRAMLATNEDPERKARALTAEFAGPVAPGEARIVVDRLRTGSGMSTLVARLEQGGEALARASLVLGKDRAPDVSSPRVSRPEATAWRDVPAMPEDFPLAPQFVRHFEMRVMPPLPFSGGDRAEATGWLRARNPGRLRDAALLVAYSDVWMPALFTLLPAPRPMATVSYSLSILAELPPGDDPLLLRASTLAVGGGFVAEMSELTTTEGTLVAVNHQTRAIIK
jgi:acyl-CoA thioesterase